jgi:hypothetical protein
VIIGYLYNPSAALGTGWDIFGYVVTGLVATMVFVVPLLGLRNQLEAEKEGAQIATHDLLQATSHRLHNKINREDYDALARLETAITALIRERELLDKISTWPWSTGTIRGFASTLLLPRFLRLVTRLPERLL